MKRVLLLAVMAIGLLSVKAQEPLSFEKVITVDSVGKDKIYSGLKTFFSMNYESQYVYDIDDRETGIIIANLRTDYKKKGFWYVSYTGFIKYTIKIQVKDGRYKVTVCNFYHDADESLRPSTLGLKKSLTLFGTITTGPNKRASINKSFDDKVWVDLQEKSKIIADNLFTSFENLKFNDKSDNW
jgi:hypothetical protein